MNCASVPGFHGPQHRYLRSERAAAAGAATARGRSTSALLLAFDNRLGRASLDATAAIDAVVRDDGVHRIAFLDRLGRTRLHARPAGGAGIGNLISHGVLLTLVGLTQSPPVSSGGPSITSAYLTNLPVGDSSLFSSVVRHAAGPYTASHGCFARRRRTVDPRRCGQVAPAAKRTPLIFWSRAGNELPTLLQWLVSLTLDRGR